MVQKQVMYRGKDVEDIKKMSIEEYIKLLPTRLKRSCKRGMFKRNEPLLKKIQLAKEGKRKKPIKTHSRNMIIIPDMIGLTIQIHNGKEFVSIIVTEEMLGKFLGEFAPSRGKVQHSAPGIGATKSSTAAASKAK